MITQAELEKKNYRFIFGKREWKVEWYDIPIAHGRITSFYNARNLAREAAIGAAAAHMVLDRVSPIKEVKVSPRVLFGMKTMRYTDLMSPEQIRAGQMLIVTNERDILVISK